MIVLLFYFLRELLKNGSVLEYVLCSRELGTEESTEYILSPPPPEYYARTPTALPECRKRHVCTGCKPFQIWFPPDPQRTVPLYVPWRHSSSVVAVVLVQYSVLYATWMKHELQTALSGVWSTRLLSSTRYMGVHDNISVPLIYMDSSDWRRGRTPPS